MTRQQNAKMVDMRNYFENYKFTIFSKHCGYKYCKYDKIDKPYSKQVKTNVNEKYKTCFFSVDFKETKNNFIGYVLRSENIKKVLSTLFQDSIERASIKLIEWDDCFLVIFQDGIHISTSYLKFEKNVVYDMFNEYKVWLSEFNNNKDFTVDINFKSEVK